MEQKIPFSEVPRASDDIADDVKCLWTREDIEVLIKKVISDDIDH